MKWILSLLPLSLLISLASAAEPLSLLIVDGQNNHNWKATTPVMDALLEKSGRFSVEVSTSPQPSPRKPRAPKEPDEKAQELHERRLADWKKKMEEYNAQPIEERWAKWRPAVRAAVS